MVARSPANSCSSEDTTPATDQPNHTVPTEDDYLVYTYNRFQACRFGLDAVYVDPATGEHLPLRDHILQTMTQLEWHSAALDATESLAKLRTDVEAGQNDARWLREGQARERLLAEMVRQAALRFRDG